MKYLQQAGNNYFTLVNARECTMACCYGTMGNLGLSNERGILFTSGITSHIKFEFCLHANFKNYGIYSG